MITRFGKDRGATFSHTIVFFPDTVALYFFPLLFLISLAGCIGGTYLAPPTDETFLKRFYEQVRPWGFWKPVYTKIAAEQPGFRANRELGRDLLNVVVGVVWQLSLTTFPMYLVLQNGPTWVLRCC